MALSKSICTFDVKPRREETKKPPCEVLHVGASSTNSVVKKLSRSDVTCRATYDRNSFVNHVSYPDRFQVTQSGRKVTMVDAQPSTSHRAIAALVRAGLARYVVTTNLDGLHRRSGLVPHLELCCLATSTHRALHRLRGRARAQLLRRATR